MPTTSRGLRVGEHAARTGCPITMCWPTGFSPGQYRFAAVSLITATSGASTPSLLGEHAAAAHRDAQGPEVSERHRPALYHADARPREPAGVASGDGEAHVRPALEREDCRRTPRSRRRASRARGRARRSSVDRARGRRRSGPRGSDSFTVITWRRVEPRIDRAQREEAAHQQSRADEQRGGERRSRLTTSSLPSRDLLAVAATRPDACFNSSCTLPRRSLAATGSAASTPTAIDSAAANPNTRQSR